MEADFIDKLAIIKYPDPRLRRTCGPVTEFDDNLRRLTERMVELMAEHNGVGLAGPQVGFMHRLFVCNPTAEPDAELVLINPEILELQGSAEAVEGCLSIPDVQVTIRRAERCRIRAQDVTGKPFEMPGEDLQTRVWQHECDHLQGKLILDYMDEAGKIANRRIIKQLEASFKA